MLVAVVRYMNPSAISGHLPPIDRALRQQIKAEQLRMLFGQTGGVTILATVFAGLLALYAAYHVPADLVLLWFALKVGTTVPRLIQAYWFKRDHVRPNVRWYRWAVTLLFLDGFSWGLAGLMLMPNQDQQTITIIAASLMCVAAAATFTLHANWVANAAYCLPIIVPSAVFLMFRGDAFGWFAAGALSAFITALMGAARKAHRHIVELLWRRFLMDRVVAEKDAALRQAERQNAIKSQFVATMSHELRTPLHGILGLTNMLLVTRLDIQQRQQLGLVQRSGEHLLSIINHILDFSRIDAGHLNVDPQPFDLEALLDDVLSLSIVTARDKGLMLQGEVRLPKPCWVMGDAPKVRQVLLNLVGNAIKFTESGRIAVRAYRRGRGGPIVVQVEDSGIGIAPQDLEHIFDPYRQAQNAVGRAVGGTGLGLTISREISRAMGGDITCESTMGKGSVFEFTAPLPGTAAGALVHQGPTSQDSTLTGHVLLAEDNDVNALIVEAQLHRHGLTVEFVGDGQAALDRLTDPKLQRPDLVLMDCQMPRMDGFEATRRLREHESREHLPRLPVIALTASAMAEDSERCLQAGMDAHLPKPFQEAQLTAMLYAHLGKQIAAA
jgi:signal transduction histidine kinase